MSISPAKRPFTAALRERLTRVAAAVPRPRRAPAEPRAPMDVQDTGDTLQLRVDVPGVAPEDIRITIDGGVLTIAGEHEETSERTDGGYVRRERRYGAFCRTVELPDRAEADRVEAHAKDGVIDITVPLGRPPERKVIEVRPTAS